MNEDKQIQTLNKSILMYDSDLDALMRQSRGSRTTAFRIISETAKHYDFELTDYAFDMACANVNDGLEVEWYQS